MIADLTSLPLADLLQALGLISLLTFLGSLIILPLLVLRMRADYFIRHHREVVERHKRHPVLAVITFFLRNSIGLCLLVAGIAMLVLPGQGILTMVLGFSCIDFPGKHRVMDRVMANKKIQHALNWIRHKGGKEDLVFSHQDIP